MYVSINGQRIEIETRVFIELLGNSVVSARAPYLRALERDAIPYTELVDLARTAEVPHPLFFAPIDHVQAQVRTNMQKLLQGIAPETFTVFSRTKIKLHEVELIIKDLLRKQELAKKYDKSLEQNKIVGLLRTPRPSVREDAKRLVSALNLDLDAIRRARSKERALEVIIRRLEANQILVSRSTHGYMPQTLHGLHFSGLTIRDSRVPYIFLVGGDHGDFQEPPGRLVFTITLMTVLVARGIFAPVTYDANSNSLSSGREYDIVGEILMPEDELGSWPLGNLDEVKLAADYFKVTPSAMAVRALRVGRISEQTSAAYLDILRGEFEARSKRSHPRPFKPVNGVRRYTGRELAKRMLKAVDESRLSEREFCRVVCLNRIAPGDLPLLREAIR